MFDLSKMLHPYLWLVLIIIVIAIGILIVVALRTREETPLDYIRKKYLFDIRTEFELFNILVELYGDRFYDSK